MTEGLKWTLNEVPKSDDTFLELMSEENVKKQMNFTKASPVYSDASSEAFFSGILSGCKNIFCKDESYRFGLNAFKVFGRLLRHGMLHSKRAWTGYQRSALQRTLF